MIRITFYTSQRDVVNVNLLFKELDMMEYNKKRDCWVLCVEKHKGAKKHGAARVSMKKDLMERLMTFAWRVRVLLPGTQEL